MIGFYRHFCKWNISVGSNDRVWLGADNSGGAICSDVTDCNEKFYWSDGSNITTDSTWMPDMSSSSNLLGCLSMEADNSLIATQCSGVDNRLPSICQFECALGEKIS